MTHPEGRESTFIRDMYNLIMRLDVTPGNLLVILFFLVQTISESLFLVLEDVFVNDYLKVHAGVVEQS
jgi:hypothetical protein